MLTFAYVTNAACKKREAHSCFFDSRVVSGNGFPFFINPLRDLQTGICSVVWHQTAHTRWVNLTCGLPANTPFSLSIQSGLIPTGTCDIVNKEGHWTNFTNEPTCYYLHVPWPWPAQTSSFQKCDQEQFRGQSTSVASCKKAVLMQLHFCFTAPPIHFICLMA